MLGDKLFAIDFTMDGESFPYRQSGWSSYEAAGFWTDAAESHLILPEPPEARCYTLLLNVSPFLISPVERQRLVVRVDGTEVGSFSVERTQVLACEVPRAGLRRDGRMRISFWQPDAARPCDLADTTDARLLGFQHRGLELRRSTTELAAGAPAPGTLAAKALLSRFESLGDTCEFGFLQRRHGVEALGLFRFAGIRLHRLLDALEDGFAALGAPGQLRIMNDGSSGNHDVYHQRYGYVYHTFRTDSELQAHDFERKEASRLRFLWRILQGDLRAGSKIFVIRSGDPVSERHLRLLMAMLRRYGDITLLWVVEASQDDEIGQVVNLGGGLLKGHVAYLTSDKAYDFAERSWLQVCAEAERIVKPELHAAMGATEKMLLAGMRQDPGKPAAELGR